MMNDTWKCHVCGDDRPDRFISVFKHERVLSGGIRMTENVRYCIDNPECIAAASSFHFITEQKEDE